MVGRGSGWQNSGTKKKIRNPEKNFRINQEMVNTKFLPKKKLKVFLNEKIVNNLRLTRPRTYN